MYKCKKGFFAESFSLSVPVNKIQQQKHLRRIFVHSNHVSSHVNLFTFNLILIFDFEASLPLQSGLTQQLELLRYWMRVRGSVSGPYGIALVFTMRPDSSFKDVGVMRRSTTNILLSSAKRLNLLTLHKSFDKWVFSQ